jgi:hypothetical protein
MAATLSREKLKCSAVNLARNSYPLTLRLEFTGSPPESRFWAKWESFRIVCLLQALAKPDGSFPFLSVAEGDTHTQNNLWGELKVNRADYVSERVKVTVVFRYRSVYAIIHRRS